MKNLTKFLSIVLCGSICFNCCAANVFASENTSGGDSAESSVGIHVITEVAKVTYEVDEETETSATTGRQRAGKEVPETAVILDAEDEDAKAIIEELENGTFIIVGLTEDGEEYPYEERTLITDKGVNPDGSEKNDYGTAIANWLNANWGIETDEEDGEEEAAAEYDVANLYYGADDTGSSTTFMVPITTYETYKGEIMTFEHKGSVDIYYLVFTITLTLDSDAGMERISAEEAGGNEKLQSLIDEISSIDLRWDEQLVCSYYTVSGDASDTVDPYADQWEYGEADGIGYYSLDVVYCSNPVNPEMQHLVIYAPAAYMTENENGTVSLNPDGEVVSSTGIVYTTENAPIIYHNTSGGYSASSIEEVDTGYIREGYIHVTVATRGKESQDENGAYIGQFPAIITDLKAGVRFLKANDDILPGNSDRIVSRGYSSGGAVSAMLGASGNSPIFDSYLEEIGAADATDDIFIALASAPITNLSSADAFYEWFQAASEDYMLFNSMAYDREGNDISDIFPVGWQNRYVLGENMLGGAHEDELSALLYDWFVDYAQGLGFDLGDDGRSGTFYEGLVQIYSDALTEYVARYDEMKELFSTEDKPLPDTAEEYLESLGDGWFTYDSETGTVTIHSLDDLVSNYLSRNKMCPSLDSYNYKSNENDAFKDADGNTVHFSSVVRDALKTLLDDADEYGFTEDELAYIQVLYEDYDSGISEESSQMLEYMSPINYIIGEDEYSGSTIAPYWRLRVGSADGDHGTPAAWMIAQGLEMYTDADVSIGIAWSMGHSLAELTEQDLYDYIAGIMAAEDNL